MALYPVCFHRSLIGVIENALTAYDKRCAGQLLAAPLRFVILSRRDIFWLLTLDCLVPYGRLVRGRF